MKQKRIAIVILVLFVFSILALFLNINLLFGQRTIFSLAESPSADIFGIEENNAFNLDVQSLLAHEKNCAVSSVTQSASKDCILYCNSHGPGRDNGGSNLLGSGCRNYIVKHGNTYVKTDIPFWINQATFSVIENENHRNLLISDIRAQVALWNDVRMYDGSGQLIRLYEVGIGSSERPVIDGTLAVEFRCGINLTFKNNDNIAGLYHSGGEYLIEINYEPGVGNRPGRTIDTPLHEIGHLLGLGDLEDIESSDNWGQHKVLMGYSRGITEATLNQAIKYQDIQGVAVANNCHTNHHFLRYVYSGDRYLHICFYCDMIQERTTALGSSLPVEDARACMHTYGAMVSAGERIWLKCTKCYKVLETTMGSHNGLFAGGTGTVSDPFLISNEYQFRNIALAHRPVYVPYQGSEDQINYAFKLTDNITLTGDWSAIAYPFTGYFEGNGKYITYSMYLTQEDIDSSAYHGLFREISDNAIIQNLELKNCSISGNKSSPLMPPGNRMTGIGILAGLIQGGGGLFSVKITCPSVDVYVNNSVMGGIAGIIYATVSNCEVTAGVVKCYDGAVGGMAGSGDISRVQGGKCTTMMVIKENYKNGDSVGKVYGNTESTANVEVDVQISHGECVAAGTLITLADGSQVPVEQLTGNEMLLVWNMQTGQFDSAPILFIDSDPAMTYRVIHLSFSDGSTVEVIYEHGFWDCDLNQYVYLDENAEQYIGHWFNKQIVTDEGTLTTYAVQLTGVSITNKITTAYSPVTYGHLCYYVNGMLSMPGGIEGLFNIFEVDAETMKYDEAQMQADIAQYGLFTYEEFAELFPVSEEVFEAFNGQYLKVAMGKGLIDAEGLQTLIERYAEFLTEIE